jgi:hypothetical protein
MMTEAEFRSQIQPALGAVATREIVELMEVSRAYAKEIQTGKRLPHPRHWATLAGLTARSGDETATKSDKVENAQPD